MSLKRLNRPVMSSERAKLEIDHRRINPQAMNKTMKMLKIYLHDLVEV